ncbi:MAG: ester cyclase [Solirubrobacteraceae bacterium]
MANQVAGTTATTQAARAAAVSKIVSDYSSNAVVNDPLFGAPLVGTAAIAVHKTAEMAAISNVSLNVLSSSIIGDQLVATWEMTGTHDGPFYSYAPTGAQIKLSGTTVQTRGQDGKITTETLYYDAADMHRQLSGG